MDQETIVQAVRSVRDMRQYTSDTLANYVRFSNEDTYNCFFKDSPIINCAPLPFENDVRYFTILYICHVIGNVPQYNFNATVRNITVTDINKWLKEKNSTIGEAIAALHLKQSLAECFTNPWENANTLADMLMNEQTLAALLLQDDLENEHQTVRFLWLLLKNLDGNLYSKVMTKWQQNQYWDTILSKFSSYPWLESTFADFSFDGSVFNSILQSVKGACNRKVCVGEEESSEVADITSSGAPIIKHYIVSIYRVGQDVMNWINNVASGYGCATNVQPDMPQTKERKSDPPPSGCVLRGTMVMMNNGTLKPIENMRKGDLVRNHRGSDSLFSGELVVNTHVTSLYSVNDDTPFMSFEHPILTQSGWKCLCPDIALEINPYMEISILKLGDVLCRAVYGNDGSLSFVPEEVKKINIAKNTDVCYDIHISDGYKSYIANGYVCGINYPEITMKNILKKIGTSDVAADGEFKAAFAQNREFLESVFDKHSLNYVEKMLDKTNLSRPLQLLPKDALDTGLLKTIEIPDMAVHPVDNGSELGFGKLSLFRGHLFFDDDKNPVELVCNESRVFWNRKMSDMTMERGMIHFSNNCTKGLGLVIRETKKISFNVSSASVYDMTVTMKDGGKTTGVGRFTMGYEKNANGRICPVGSWMIDNSSSPIASTNDGTLSYSVKYEDKISHLAVTADTSVAYGMDIVPFGYCEMEFDAVYKSLKGDVYDGPDNEGNAIAVVEGKLCPGETLKLLELAGHLTKFQMAKQFSFQPIMTMDEISAIKSEMPLSVESLFLLPQPSANDMTNIHGQCFNRLRYMALYAASEKDKELFSLFGEPPPLVDDDIGELTLEQAEVAKKDEISKFLINKFAMGYLASAYSRNSDSKISGPITGIKDYDKKIAFFFQGSKKDLCLSATKEYKTASDAIYNTVYKSNVTGLSDYVNNNKEYWAKELYNYCIDPDIIRGIVTTHLVSPDDTRILHLSTLLNILDNSGNIAMDPDPDKPKVSYGAAFYEKAMNEVFAEFFIKAKSSNVSKAEDFFKEYLTGFLKEYIKLIVTNPDQTLDDNIRKEALEELQKAAKEGGYADIEAYAQHITETVADITSEILKLSDADLRFIPNKIFKRFPKLPAVFTVGFYAFGISTLILGYCRYDELSIADRSKLIGATVDIGVSLIRDGTVFRAAKVLKSGYGDLLKANADITQAFKEEDFVRAFSCTSTKTEALTKLGLKDALLTTEAEDVVVAAARWQKFIRITSVAAKAVSILAMGVAAGFAVYQTVVDFNSGQSVAIETLDIIDTIATGVAFLVDAGSGIAALCGATVCSAIPVAGVIIAAVGIIVAFVLIWIHRNEPKSPVEAFIENRCAPFVKDLSDPEEKWLNDYQKLEQHLKKSA
jgi:hypothetical protein